MRRTIGPYGAFLLLGVSFRSLFGKLWKEVDALGTVRSLLGRPRGLLGRPGSLLRTTLSMLRRGWCSGRRRCALYRVVDEKPSKLAETRVKVTRSEVFGPRIELLPTSTTGQENLHFR
mgnify:CR=1 FL=1